MAVRTAEFPTLVATGGHDPVFELVGDRLSESLSAQRLVLAGAGHAVQRAPDANAVLERFWLSAER